MSAKESFNEFRTFLKEASGIELGDDKYYLVHNRLRRILEEHELKSLDALVSELRRDRSTSLRSRVVDAMTTQETLWFRDQYPFIAIKEIVLPSLVQAKRFKGRIWSAACSTGQEPYSISIAIEEAAKGMPSPLVSQTEVIATDISPSALATAREGAYDGLALSRGLSPERLERFFVREVGGRWKLNDEIRRRVSFAEFNLTGSYARLGMFDAIFCRNVLIYFEPELKRNILRRMVSVLRPGGYFFVGGPESVSSYSEAFEPVAYRGGMIYRLRAALA